VRGDGQHVFEFKSRLLQLIFIRLGLQFNLVQSLNEPTALLVQDAVFTCYGCGPGFELPLAFSVLSVAHDLGGRPVLLLDTVPNRNPIVNAVGRGSFMAIDPLCHVQTRN
jgi:hypothetical protein